MTRGRGWPLAILAGVAIVLAAGVLLPMAEAFVDQRDDAVQAQADLARYRAEIAALPRLRAERDVLSRSDAATAALLTGDSAALASANLQSLIKTLVERHGGQVRSAQTLSSAPAGGVERVVVQEEISLPVASLAAATYEIESGVPYIFIDATEIRPELYTGDAMSAPVNLHVLWTIHGYRRSGAP
jgi:general secretion pathway protein M